MDGLRLGMGFKDGRNSIASAEGRRYMLQRSLGVTSASHPQRARAPLRLCRPRRGQQRRPAVNGYACRALARKNSSGEKAPGETSGQASSASGASALYEIPIQAAKVPLDSLSGFRHLGGQRKEGPAMLDALAILALVAVTAVAVGYAHLCERL